MTASKNPKLRFKDENGKDFPNWRNIRLEDLLDYEQPSKYIVKNIDYSNEYITPVLTAGKSFILGYTNENNGIFNKEKLPVIIFDDFTTAFKFVNFPFKVKSSAIKILHNKSDKNSNIRFVFNRMLGINFKLGDEHKRHWISEYSKLEINIPNIDEQEKISNFLTSVDSYIQNLKSQKEELEKYKKAVMQKIFSQQIRFKDANGKNFPDWTKEKLGKLCKITTGKLDANAMVKGGKYRFYTCAKDYFEIDNYAFDTEALLISGNGANVGYIHYYKGKFNAYQRTYVLDNFKSEILYIKFYLDKYLYARIESEKKAGNTPYIVMSTLSDMEIFLPSSNEQKIILNFFTNLDKNLDIKDYQIKLAVEWKKGLMQQMFI